MSLKEISTIVKTTCTAIVATVVAVCLIMLTKNANQTMASFREDVSNIKNDVIDVKNDVHDVGDKINKTLSEKNRNYLSSILNKVDDQVLSAGNIDKVKNSLNRLDSITEKIDNKVLSRENIRKAENSLSTVNNVASGARTVGNWFSFALHTMVGW